MAAPAGIELIPIPGLPLVAPGDDVSALLIAAMTAANLSPAPRDVLVVAQKILSKAEGRQRDLAAFVPSPKAVSLARTTGKDARLVEAILGEAQEVVASKPGVIVVANRQGHVMANAGIDRSNIAGRDDSGDILLLPEDPDAGAAAIKRRLDAHFGVDLGIVVSDSVGRAWRIGTVGLALGVAGLPAVIDRRGEPDLFGRPLAVTMVGFADAIASAASLVMGEGDEGYPAVLVRGLTWSAAPTTSQALLRSEDEDMFR